MGGEMGKAGGLALGLLLAPGLALAAGPKSGGGCPGAGCFEIIDDLVGGQAGGVGLSGGGASVTGSLGQTAAGAAKAPGVSAGSGYFRFPFPYRRLQVILPGETANEEAPGGKTGVPLAQIRDQPFNVTVRGLDDFFQLVSTPTFGAGDLVSLGTIPVAIANLPLVGGTTVFSNVVLTATATAVVLASTDTVSAGITSGVSLAFNVVLPNVSSPTVTLNIANSTVATLGGSLKGQASDASAVNKILVALRSLAAGKFYAPWPAPGGGFASAAPVFGTATLASPGAPNTNWSLGFIDFELTDGTSYYVRMQATNASNLVSVGEATFTFKASALVFGGNNGKGDAFVLPAVSLGCEPVIATVTYTVGGASIKPGGGIALRVPEGWTIPTGTTTANPPGEPGFVTVASTSTALPGSVLFINPAALGGLSLGNGWIVLAPGGPPFLVGQKILFTYFAYPSFGPQGRGPQVFQLGTMTEAGTTPLSISTLPVMNLIAGTTSYISFTDYGPVFLGPLQTSSTMQLRLTDLCGNPKPAGPGVLSATFSAGNYGAAGFAADTTAKFFRAGGTPTNYIDFLPNPLGLSNTFYYHTSSAGITYEFLRATATLPAPGGFTFAETNRFISIFSSTLALTGVSIDTGSLSAGATSAALTAGSFSSFAAIRFGANFGNVPWEVVISTDAASFFPAVFRAFGFTDPARPQQVSWNAITQDGPLSRFVGPGVYKVRIRAGGGSVEDRSLEVKILASPSIRGQLGDQGALAFVNASGQGVNYGNFTVASSTGYFQIFGLKNGQAYNIFASTGIQALGQFVELTTAAFNVTATDAGTLIPGVLGFPTTAFIRVNVTGPPAPREFWGGVFAHNADYTSTAFGSLHFFQGSAVSDNGAQSFGQSASTWTLLVLSSGTYDLEINLPELRISTRISGKSVGAGQILEVPLVLEKKANIFGYAVLPGTTPFGSWVSVEAKKAGNKFPTVFGGTFISAASGSVNPTSNTYTLFGLDPGSWSVTAKTFGFVSTTTAIAISSNADVGEPSGQGGLALPLGLGGVIQGTVTVLGDTGKISQCFNFGGPFSAGCLPGTYDLGLEVYSPRTFEHSHIQVRMSTSATSASSTFTVSGLESGVHVLRSFLKGFELTPPGGQSVLVSTPAVSTVTLTLAANDSRLELHIRVPALAGGACYSSDSFRSLGLFMSGSDIPRTAAADITTITPVQLGGLTYHDPQTGARETYFCSSMTFLAPAAGTGYYKFAAFWGRTGAHQIRFIPLANHATAVLVMDLGVATFPVSGKVTFSGNVTLPAGGAAAFTVTVSSLAGVLANAPRRSYCLLSSTNPVTVSTLHLELIPIDPFSQRSRSPLPLTRAANLPGACARIPIEGGPGAPGAAAGGGGGGDQDPTVVAYVAAVSPEGIFQFPGVPAGLYLLRNLPDLDQDPGNGLEMAEYQATLRVTSAATGVEVRLTEGVEVSGTLLLPPGVLSSRPMSVSLQDSRGNTIKDLFLNFDNSNSVGFFFDRVGDGRYAISVRDEGLPRAFTAQPLVVDIQGLGLADQDIQLRPGGTIKAQIAVQQTSVDGSHEFILISRQNANLLPKGLSVNAIANPWFQGGFYFAKSSQCGPEGCRGISLDDNGQVVIENVFPGAYDVEFNSRDSQDDRAEGGLSLVSAVHAGVDVAEGQTVDLGVIRLLSGVTLSGRVTDVVTSTPIANVKLRARPAVKLPGQKSGRESEPEVTTDREGRYAFSRLDPTVRFYDIFAAVRAGELDGEVPAPYEQKIVPAVDIKNTATLDFALLPASFTLTGRILSVNNEPLLSAIGPAQDANTGAVIFLQKVNVIPVENPIADLIHITDSYGNFTIPSLTAGTYRMTVTALSYATVSRIVLLSASANLGDIQMGYGGSMFGTIRKPDGSAPGEDEVHLMIGATPDLSDFFFGLLKRDPNTRTVTDYRLSGFKPGVRYRLLLLSSDDELHSPSEASNIVFTSSVEARNLDLVLRPSKPFVLAKTRRSGSQFLIDLQVSQSLRAKTTDDDNLELLLTTVSASGILSERELSANRMKLTAVYAPGVSESSFSLRVKGFSAIADPDSLDPVDPEFLINSTVTFFVGVDGLHRANVSNLLGGALLIEGDAGRVTLPKGAFDVDASSSVEVVLQKSADVLSTAGQPAGLSPAEANIRAMRYAPGAYPSGLFQAMASKPPGVSPLSAFYDILLPLGIRTALSRPVQMCVSYSTGTDPEGLNLYWYNAAANAYILQQDVTGAPAVIDTVNRTKCININHFSTFVLFNTGVAVITGNAFPGSEISAFNFPNPFDLSVKTVNPIHGPAAQTVRGTMIRFGLPAEVSGAGSIRIYNVVGERVRTIDLGTLAGGQFFYQGWDGRNDSGRDVASGVYIGQIKVGSKSRFFKMALIK